MGQSTTTFLRAGRFVTLMLASLSLSLSMAHLLELPQRMQFDQQLWVEVTVVENVYRLFGSVGAVFDIGAMLAAMGLAFWVRKRGPVFYWALAGASFLGLAFVSWLLLVVPMNAELATWLTEPVPADWTSYRNQWEFAHAAIALLKILALGCLLGSVLLEPSPQSARPASADWLHPTTSYTPSSTRSRASADWLWPLRLVAVIVVSAVFFGLVTYVFHSVLVGTVLSVTGILGAGFLMDR